MIRDHLAAVVALLEASVPATCTVHVGDVGGALEGESDPAPATPYLVVHTDTMPVTSDRLGQWSNRLDARFYVKAVGATWREAAWGLEHARAALLDVTPTVPGRTCGPLHLGDGQPVDKDRDVTPALFYGVDVYRLMSVTASS